uniref:Cytochrome P450 n=1 Tax=Leersia perrieri TaxID=77586 RepID=A0A0D9X1X2_9ORYZ
MSCAWPLVAAAVAVLAATLLFNAVARLVWRPRAVAAALLRQGVRGPGYKLFVGNLREIKRLRAAAAGGGALDVSSHDFIPFVQPHFRRWIPLYGRVFLYWFGSTPDICVADVEIAKQVLSDRTGLFPKNLTSPVLLKLIGNGLVLANGDDWQRHKKMMTATMAGCARSMVSRWEEKVASHGGQAVIEVSSQFEEITADVIAHTAFGSSFAEGKQAFVALRELQFITFSTLLSVQIPGSRYFPTKRNLRVWSLDKTVRSTLTKIINNRLAGKEKSGSGYSDDLLGLMLEASAPPEMGEKGHPMLSMDEIIDECKTFFFAGQETTSHLLTWTMFLLGTHPEWQEKLREEVARECGGGDDNEKLPTYDMLGRLKLLNLFLLETLRLYTPVPMIRRRTRSPAEIGGVAVPAGTMLTFPIATMHRDEAVWGPDAGEFDPTRFAAGGKAAAMSMLLSFSVGPRACVGQGFAMAEAKAVVALILRRFRVSISPEYVHWPTDVITLRPKFGLPMVVTSVNSCAAFEDARRLHAAVLVGGHGHGTVLVAQLVRAYAKLGELGHALRVFDGMPRRNSFAWNAVIKGLVDVGRLSDALEMFWEMVHDGSVAADGFTYPPVIKACAALGDVEQGRKVWEIVEADIARGDARPNVFVQCALVNMFAKCGCLDEARRVFESMEVRDLVAWTAMIGGSVHAGDWIEVVDLFNQMRSEGFGVDSVIAATVISACGRAGELQVGIALHGCAMKSGVSSDICVSNALVDMYCKCGYVEMADCLFRYTKSKDVVSWSSLIAGYSQNGMHNVSISLFCEMISSGIKPNSSTLASILPCLSDLKLIRNGKEIHCFSIRHGLEISEFVVSALIDLYSRQGLIRVAETIFWVMPDKDLAIWNSMIAGYAVNGHPDSAFCALRALQKVGLRPDHVTVVSILPVCNQHSMVIQGKELHAYIVKHHIGSVCSVNNALIDMYCNCGFLEVAKDIFRLMTERNTVTYNILISSFGKHSHEDQALSFFDLMKRDGIAPDKVTFVALLSCCSHAGLIDKGLHFYRSMLQDYNISPEKEHYSCIVDLYSRYGKLDEACCFITNMVEEPEIDVLGGLLGACRVHNRMDIAEMVGKRILEQNPNDPGYHILLSNIYADAGMWSDVIRMRNMMQEKSLKKEKGNSLT